MATQTSIQNGIARTEETARTTFGDLSHGTPSAPLLGLPLARIVPQDVHSMADYLNGVLVGGAALLTTNTTARVVSAVLGASVVGVSAITDYRLSVAKIVPIEAHEAIDHVWGLSCIAAPFLFGYWKKSPQVAISHIVTGALTVAASLITDYRAERGVGRARRA